MKLAIIGAGMIVKDFLTMIHNVPTVELVAIVGVEQDRQTMASLKLSYGIQSIYTDLDTCLDSEEIDTVYVGLPNHLHYLFAKKALKRGKNVICEKPFTLSLEQLEELEEIADSNNLIIVEAITNQYLGNFDAIKAKLPELGDLKIIECNYSQYSSRYDAFKRGEILPAFDPKKGGGALMDINIYNIHLVIGLLGLPKSVNYIANVEKGIDTSGMLILDYGQTKVNCIGAKDSTSAIRSTIQGTKGSIVIEGPTNALMSFSKQIQKQEAEEFNFNKYDHRMVDEFIAFDNMISTKNFKQYKARMNHSKNVMKVVELALTDAGVNLG